MRETYTDVCCDICGQHIREGSKFPEMSINLHGQEYHLGIKFYRSGDMRILTDICHDCIDKITVYLSNLIYARSISHGDPHPAQKG